MWVTVPIQQSVNGVRRHADLAESNIPRGVGKGIFVTA